MTPRALKAERWIKRAIVLLAVLAIAVTCARAYGAETRCQSKACLKRAVTWQRHDRQRLEKQLAQKIRPDARYALRLAAAYSGLPIAKLDCIAWHESSMGTQTWPEPGSHASGLMQFLPSTWSATPFAAYGFSVWDLNANALAAAQIIVHDGSARQWVTGRGCGL